MRAIADASVLYAQPLGEFGQQIDWGVGAAFGLRVPVRKSSPLSFRVDASVINYGHETREMCLSPTVGCRVQVKQVTSNDIVSLGVGPELAGPDRRLQPFLHGFAGVTAFVTESSLRGRNDHDGFAGTYNQHDFTFSWGGGAGVRARIPVAGVPVHLNLAGRYQNNGHVEYLRSGDITDQPDGSITLNRQRSRADLLSFHVGASVGVRMPKWPVGSGK